MNNNNREDDGVKRGRIGKNIIICTDGTGNRGGRGNGTNVWRLYESIDRSDINVNSSGREQIAYYDDGVGTSDFKPWKIIGGAFGWGLSQNIRESYEFIVRHYEPGDRIFLFGFSRGAFTARCLSGLIQTCGVVKRGDTDEDLRFNAYEAFRAYRYNYWHPVSGRQTYPLNRDEEFKQARIKYRSDWRVTTGHGEDNTLVPIECIGVWDTVGSIGLPINELQGMLTWGLSQAAKIKRCSGCVPVLEFLDGVPAINVKGGLHALAIDDRRKAFKPKLWTLDSNNSNHKNIDQVWFAGMHSDVGGGYAKYHLSLVSFNWMVDRLRTAPYKLGFIDSRLCEYKEQENELAAMHDSRSGLAVYYRYKPRNIGRLHQKSCNGNCQQSLQVHESVLNRIREGAGYYAPYNLPGNFNVVCRDNSKASLPGYSVKQWPENAEYFGANAEYAAESGKQIDSSDSLATNTCKRTLAYLLFVLTSLTFIYVLYFLQPAPTGYSYAPYASLPSESRFVAFFSSLSGSLVEGIAIILSPILPETLRLRFVTLAGHPLPFVFYLLVFVGLLFWSKYLKYKVHCMADNLWSHAFRGSKIKVYTRKDYRKERVDNCPWKDKVFVSMAILFIAVATYEVYRINKAQADYYFPVDQPKCVAEKTESDADEYTINFDSRCYIYETGIEMNKDHIYTITSRQVESNWFDQCTPASMDGFGRVTNDIPERVQYLCPDIKKIPESELSLKKLKKRREAWERKLLFKFFSPFRRSTDEGAGWFKLMAQVGDNNPQVIGKHEKTIIGSGRLTLFVNDVSWPARTEWPSFYSNNTGTAEVTIKIDPR